jgi:rSAM/selenodomain-associated transferase 1
MTGTLLVMAKAPVPGKVKTRLCPPCTPEVAAGIAAASLADTLDAAGAVPGTWRVLVLDGAHRAPEGWTTVRQSGVGLGERLAQAFADTRRPGRATLLIGMDTPQVTAALLGRAFEVLESADAVLGAAADGGWWALGLREPGHAAALRDVPMSTSRTGVLTLRALRVRGLRVAPLPMLRDVDTAGDVVEVARLCPAGSRFAAAVHPLLTAAATTSATTDLAATRPATTNSATTAPAAAGAASTDAATAGATSTDAAAGATSREAAAAGLAAVSARPGGGL